MKKWRQPLFCPYCGGKISPKNTTCPHCSTDLSNMESQLEEHIAPETGFREAIQRIIGTLYKPDKTFKEISQTPDSKGPFLIISIMIIVASIQTIFAIKLVEPIEYTFLTITSSYLIQSLLVTPSLPLLFQETFLIIIISSLLSITLPLSIIIIAIKFIALWLIFGLIYWILSKILRGEGNFKNTLIILAYAGTPQIIGIATSIIPTLLILTQPSTILWLPLPTNTEEYIIRLALWLTLIETTINTPLTITLQFTIPNLTLLWTGILISYGLNHTHKIPKNKSLIIGLIIPLILITLSLLYQTTIPLP